MTIYEQLLKYFEEAKGRVHTTAEIKAELEHRYGANPASVIPSDYCYNRWNHGVTTQKPLLLRVGPGEYRFIGPDQPYSGRIYGRPRGETEDQVVGEWKNGHRKLF